MEQRNQKIFAHLWIVLLSLCILLPLASPVKLTTLQYNVGGDVSIKGEKVVIKNFSYTGGAPDAFFYVGTSGSPADAGTIGTYVQYPAGQDRPLGAYSGQDLEFPLPSGVLGSDITWVSVWCRQYSVNFGQAMLVTDAGTGTNSEQEAEPESESGSESGSGAEIESESEPESGSGVGQVSWALVLSLVWASSYPA
eukprot:GFUD01083634.1.p1 GENE.GFUD01083634.1~~GFUD01083634.1.p1  ORF type:complete len:195 (-),score=46.96 GFUD01083634.1:27-611(-)